jgi:hypothetical protein
MNPNITRLISACFVILSTPLFGAEHTVGTDAEFVAVQKLVKPGDRVVLKSGDYGKLEWDAKGKPGNPITVSGMTRQEYQANPDKLAGAERRLESLNVGGAYTIFTGLRFVGDPEAYGCVQVSGEHIRITDSVFDGCLSKVWLSTNQKAYEFRVDHCRFAEKDFEKRSGQYVRLFAGESQFPAGHVIDHNQFGPKKTWRTKNGNETIQPFHATKNPGIRFGGEEDMLIMCNLFTRSASENEMLSAKCDSVFFLLNTLIRDKETTLRTGRNHTIEACYFLVNTDASRSCGANNLYRNNYHHFMSGTHKLWGESKGYSGAKHNWIVNNTFMFGSPYTAQGVAEDIHVINNLFGRGYGFHESRKAWVHKGNMAAVMEPEDGKPALVQIPGVSYHRKEAMVVKDNSVPTQFKDSEGYKDDLVYKVATDSPLIGAAEQHVFVGGLDPRGNPVPAEGANVGCFQRGEYNIFGPYAEGDLGPFTARGDAPEVRIVTPSEGATINGRVTVRVEASDPEDALAYVYLMLNNQPVSVDADAPFKWVLEEMLLNQCNRIRAVAIDRDGNVTYDRVNIINAADSNWVRNVKPQE